MASERQAAADLAASMGGQDADPVPEVPHRRPERNRDDELINELADRFDGASGAPETDERPAGNAQDRSVNTLLDKWEGEEGEPEPGDAEEAVAAAPDAGESEAPGEAEQAPVDPATHRQMLQYAADMPAMRASGEAAYLRDRAALQAAEQAFTADLQRLEAMRTTDPGRYMNALATAQQHERQLRESRQQIENGWLQTQQYWTAVESAVERERVTLHTTAPELTTEEGAAAVVKYAESQGFERAEIDSLSDARVWSFLAKAQRSERRIEKAIALIAKGQTAKAQAVLEGKDPSKVRQSKRAWLKPKRAEEGAAADKRFPGGAHSNAAIVARMAERLGE